ncbi:MAG: hypothetical protein M3Q99_00200 [Acidobacteriota bacterium]|nr:hypothetical protein [Acidobacteriota bacterium]
MALLFLSAGVFAQVVKQPRPTVVLDNAREAMPLAAGNNLYCAGYVQTASINTANKIVGAENEQEQNIYAQGDNLYINVGANKGVKVGDMFAVVRPRGQVETRWSRKKNLGFYVQEVGALEIIRVKSEVSVARVRNSCDNLLLGDLLQPIEPRTSPLFQAKPALDVFGEPTGKASGRIFMARDGRELLGREQIVYIDLGAEDRVNVGDYLTVYRPLGKGNLFENDEDESVSARDEGFQSDEYRGGKFSNQAARKSGSEARGKVVTTEEAKKDRPQGLRKIVGEVVILNVREKTATAIITRAAQEIHTGDMVEMQ